MSDLAIYENRATCDHAIEKVKDGGPELRYLSSDTYLVGRAAIAVEAITQIRKS